MKKGDRFGTRVVTSDPWRQGHNKVVSVLCHCGTESIARVARLMSGESKTCQTCSVATHGKSRSRTYGSWQSMLIRCKVKTASNYKNYGGRGISVCKRWDKFENFLADMGERPSDGHTIDRINNNKNYSKANCRWADGITQGNNRRNNVMITRNGKTMTGRQWDRELGLRLDTITQALGRGSNLDKYFKDRK